jgi:tRNA (guanosine-2'-O-)-methyltransferase
MGKPLSLEVPGNIAHHLASFITAERYARLTEVLSKRTRRLSCFLENVFDPHNLSACMRSCDAFGIQDVHILPQEGLKLKLSGDVSSGSHRWLDHTVYSNVTDAIEHFKAEGYQIVVTDLQGDSPPLNLEEVPIGAKTMVAFGSEHEGISDTLRRAADLRIAVPMHGFVQSLNISVACALTMQRLRERQISETGVAGDLSENQRRQILDRWILNDLPKSRQILEELRRRALEPAP